MYRNDWLEEKAKAHERMKAASSKPRYEEIPVTTVTKTKTVTKVFAATTSNQGNAVTKIRCEKNHVTCKDSHPLWRCTFITAMPATKKRHQRRL